MMSPARCRCRAASMQAADGSWISRTRSIVAILHAVRVACFWLLLKLAGMVTTARGRSSRRSKFCSAHISHSSRTCVRSAAASLAQPLAYLVAQVVLDLLAGVLDEPGRGFLGTVGVLADLEGDPLAHASLGVGDAPAEPVREGFLPRDPDELIAVAVEADRRGQQRAALPRAHDGFFRGGVVHRRHRRPRAQVHAPDAREPPVCLGAGPAHPCRGPLLEPLSLPLFQQLQQLADAGLALLRQEILRDQGP